MKNKTISICFFLFYFLFLNHFQLSGSQKDSILIDAFYRNLYDYRFQSADSVLQVINKQEISRETKSILQISYTWWQIISGDNNINKIDSLFKQIDFNISSIEERDHTSELTPTDVIQLIILFSYKSRLHNYQNNKLAGFTSFKRSFKYFEQLVPCDFPDCEMYNFIAGMYYSLGGHMSDQYSPVYFLYFDKKFADIEKGYRLLNECSKSQNNQVRTESIYFLMKLYLEVQEDPISATWYSKQLVSLYPDNLVFRYNQILTLHEQGNSVAADSAYHSLVVRSQNNKQLTTRQKLHFQEEYKKLH